MDEISWNFWKCEALGRETINYMWIAEFFSFFNVAKELIAREITLLWGIYCSGISHHWKFQYGITIALSMHGPLWQRLYALSVVVVR